MNSCLAETVALAFLKLYLNHNKGDDSMRDNTALGVLGLPDVRYLLLPTKSGSCFKKQRPHKSKN